MFLSDVSKFVAAMWDDCSQDMGNSTPLLLLGPPGIGKTSACRAAAEEMTRLRRESQPDAGPAFCRVLDTSSMLPEDLNGVPYRDGSVTRYAPQSWMAELTKPDAYGVLCLDDIPVSAPAVQVACRQLMLERRIHDCAIAPGIVLMATGNRREDKSSASTLPAHFRNSVVILEIQPQFGDAPGEGWTAWYGSQAGHDPIVASFLRFKPSLFSQLPKDADERGAFPTPRTWTKLGRLMKAAEKMGDGKLLEIAQGLVGSAATEFVAFVKTRSKLVAPEEVLRDPAKALPDPKAVLDTPDKAYTMVTGLGEVAARWKTGNGALAFLRATSHVTVGNREYIAAGVMTYIANGGKSTDLLRVAREHQAKDPLIKALTDFLSKALK